MRYKLLIFHNQSKIYSGLAAALIETQNGFPSSFAGETLSSIIQFDFDKNYELFEMTKIYPVIKNFLDLLVTARNTDYKIKLYQKLNDEEIDFDLKL